VIRSAAGQDIGALRTIPSGKCGEMTASIEVARLAGAAGAQIPRVPDGPPRPRLASRQRAAILIMVVLAAGADLAPLAVFAIVLAAIRDLVRDSQVIPHALTWYFGPAPAWYIRRRNRRYLRQQMLDAPAGLCIFMPAGDLIGRDVRTMDHQLQMRLDEPCHLVRKAGMARLSGKDGCRRGRARGRPVPHV
jgi:hypothetical protein